MANSSGSSHPIFRASSAFESGRSRGGGKKSIHFNGYDENIELLLRTVISANHLSVYGAVADLCNELSEDFRAPGKLAALDRMENMKILNGFSIEKKKNSTTAQRRKTCCKNMSEKSNNSQKTRSYPSSVLMRV